MSATHFLFHQAFALDVTRVEYVLGVFKKLLFCFCLSQFSIQMSHGMQKCNITENVSFFSTCHALDMCSSFAKNCHTTESWHTGMSHVMQNALHANEKGHAKYVAYE